MVDGGAGAADPEVAVAEPVAAAADIGSVGADVVISAACTALPQPAAAATRTSPNPISDRRDRLIPTAQH